jgi:hypothetical protein
MIVGGLILAASMSGHSTSLAQSEPAFIRWVRAFDPDRSELANPAGLAFSGQANTFYVLEQEATPGAGSNIVLVSPFGDVVGTVNVGVEVTDPINMTFDSQANRLLLYEGATEELIEIRAGADGQLDPGTLTRYPAQSYGVQNARGMAVDPQSGQLIILDASGPRLVRVEPDAGQGFGQVTVTVVDLEQTGLVEPQGLAIDPNSGHLHIASPSEQKLYELTQSGQEIAYRDLSEFDLSNPQGMVIAASGDPTDNPSELSLYLADSGLSGGQIVELSFTQPLQLISIAADIEATLVQTTATSLFASPSPDPAGVAYLNPSDTLLISDSEVNEMTIFEGANLFETTLTGTLVMTSTTMGWTVTGNPAKVNGEPTGAAYKSAPNPANARFFSSNDVHKEVFVAAAGADGDFGTGDDSVSSFDTEAFGSMDPEGIAYDSWQDVLYISDGLTNEMFKVDPGSNGVFDGVPPAGDDVVTAIDVSSFVSDPEGIAFDQNNGHIYIIGNGDQMAEITVTGNLLRTIGIAAANAVNAAGLEYAPSSGNPAQWSMYIVDRGIDNNADPNENDGVLFEMSFPGLAPVAPVAVNDNPNIFEDTPTPIDVASNDTDADGVVDPSSVNTTCLTCSVPTNGGLTNNGDGTFDYSPNPDYSGPDSFVYEICDFGALCDTASVNITVIPTTDPPVANDDNVTTPEDTPKIINVTANDTDADGNLNLASTNTTCPSCSGTDNGDLTPLGNGIFAYDPDLNYNGSDSFVYEICDFTIPTPLCDTATVDITITAVDNDPPIAVDDEAFTPENTAKAIFAAANDTDPDDNLDPDTANTACPTCTGPSNGTVDDNPNGVFIYTPNPGFGGIDSFIYEICDETLPVALCDTATVTVTINRAPVATNDTASTPEDTAKLIDVAANDSDPEGNLDPTTANTTCPTCSTPSDGDLTNNGNGTFTYDPDSGFTGSDSFVYEICDTGDLCDTATVNISVGGSPVYLPAVLK